MDTMSDRNNHKHRGDKKQTRALGNVRARGRLAAAVTSPADTPGGGEAARGANAVTFPFRRAPFPARQQVAPAKRRPPASSPKHGRKLPHVGHQIKKRSVRYKNVL